MHIFSAKYKLYNKFKLLLSILTGPDHSIDESFDIPLEARHTHHQAHAKQIPQ
jgi:hypothetical protein